MRHRLAETWRTDDVAAIADSLVALHSTDPATVYLSAVARMATPTLDAVSLALYEQRTLIRHHGMRQTLWVMTPEVARIVHAACTSLLARAEWRRLAKLVEDSGIATNGAAWVEQAQASALNALNELGTATARQLAGHVPALGAKLSVGKSYAGTQGAHTRLLGNLGFEGVIVRGRPRGSWTSSEYAWSVMNQWLPGGVSGAQPAAASAELARRYLSSFGPATTSDLLWWTGWTVGTTKQALETIDAVEVQVDGGPAWVLPNDLDPLEASEPYVAFLPGLDPTTMGWKHRNFVLGEHGRLGGPLFDQNGNAGATVWMDGRVVGGWAQRPDGSVVYRLLESVTRGRIADLDRAAAALRDLLAGVVIKPRFSTLVQKQLSS